MKNLNLNFPFLLLIAVTLLSCSQKKNQDQDDITAINEFYTQYLHFLETKDLDSFMNLWDDNAMRAAPGLPTTFGKEDIRAIFKEIFATNYNKLSPTGESKIEVCGNIAYGYSTFTLTTILIEGGTAMQTDMKVLTIFKRQPDGSWKLFIDCLNLHPTWSMDSIPSELKEDNPFY